MNTLAVNFVIFAVDPSPEAADVKAGWIAFGLFLALAVAVILLGMNLNKQLRKTERNFEAGVFGDEPKKADDSTD